MLWLWVVDNNDDDDDDNNDDDDDDVKERTLNDAARQFAHL